MNAKQDHFAFHVDPTIYYLCYWCEEPVQGRDAMYSMDAGEPVVLCKKCKDGMKRWQL